MKIGLRTKRFDEIFESTKNRMLKEHYHNQVDDLIEYSYGFEILKSIIKSKFNNLEYDNLREGDSFFTIENNYKKEKCFSRVSMITNLMECFDHEESFSNIINLIKEYSNIIDLDTISVSTFIKSINAAYDISFEFFLFLNKELYE